MRFSILSVLKHPIRIILVVILAFGLFLVQSAVGSSVYAQQETGTPTETRIRLVSNGGYCGPDLGKLNLSLQFQVIKATRSLKGTLCGRLVIIKDIKTKKDYLGLMPCTGGGPYIFATRPRELLNYYQLINVKFKTGNKIRAEGYGDLTRYIVNFDTYYPMVDCSGCGYLPGYAPVSTQSEFIFPGSTPNSTPSPLLAQAQLAVGGGIEESGSSDFVFPTPTTAFEMSDISLEPSKTPTPTANSSPQLAPSASEGLVALPQTQTSIPTPSPTIQAASLVTRAPAVISGVLNNTKPPIQPPFGILGYSLYTFLLVPPIVFWILWRRARMI